MITEQRVMDLLNNHITWRNSFIQAYCRWHFDRTDGPLAYGLAGGLTLLATNAHKDLSVYQGHRVYANLWTMLVGSSGYSRKTTALKLAQEIQTLVDVTKIGSEPGSVEGLDASLAEVPQQCLYFEEYGDFLSRSAAKGYFQPIREKFTRLYDCTSSHKQLSKTSVEIIDPRVSLFAAVTPSYLERFTSHTDWEGGFFGRKMTFIAEPERNMPRPKRQPELKDWLGQRLFTMAQIRLHPCMDFTADAQVCWDRWYNGIREICMSADPWVSAAGARVTTNALKICLLLALDAFEATGNYDPAGAVIPVSGINPAHAVIQPPFLPAWRITLPILRAAIQIAEMAFDSLHVIVNQLCSTRYERERRNVLRAIRSRKERIVTLRKIVNRTAPKMEKRDVVRVLDTLVLTETIYLRMNKTDLYSFDPPVPEELKTL